METRSFPIPAKTALALTTAATAVTTACAPAIVGDWAATSWSYNGDVTQLPYSSSSDTGGYDSYLGVTMSVDSDLTGSFDINWEVSYAGTSYDLGGSYTLTAEASGGDFSVSVPDLYDLQLTCSVSGTDMNCTGTDEDGGSYDIDYVAN